MYRVKELLAQPFFKKISISFHKFENYPTGIESHATAPLDWLICLLSLILSAFPENMDLAGLLIGPILAGLVGFTLFSLSKELKLGEARWLLLGTYLLSPPLIWSCSIGRPDHQCLIASLITLAILFESIRWQKPTYHPFAGSCWGLALWTSLWEPLILFSCVLLLNLIKRKHEHRAYLMGLGVMLVSFLAVDGLPSLAMSAEDRKLIMNWLATIGEIEHLHWLQLLQIGLPIFALPYLFYKKPSYLKHSTPFYLILTLFVWTIFLSFFQKRWLPYMCVMGLFLTPLLFYQYKKKKTFIMLYILQFLPLIIWNIWEYKMVKQPTELAELRELATEAKPNEALLGPWWHSPAFLYYARTPIVASSSHQSLAGTLDSAQFFTTQSFVEAKKILEKRQVRWVLISTPSNLYMNSFQILYGHRPYHRDIPKNPETDLVLLRLWYSKAVPKWLNLRGVTDHYRLYEVVQD
ncbi:MAG: hypothetical protein AAGA18_09040 [Verrucomicrobiota bacterium]